MSSWRLVVVHGERRILAVERQAKTGANQLDYNATGAEITVMRPWCMAAIHPTSLRSLDIAHDAHHMEFIPCWFFLQ